MRWHSDEQVVDPWSWGAYSEFQVAAAPGRSVYQVAVSAIHLGGQTFQCPGSLRWAETFVATPTAEERAQIEEERDILIAEATRCAKESLTRNLSDEAVPIIEAYIDRSIADEFSNGYRPDANEELVGITVTMCGMSKGDSGYGFPLGIPGSVRFRVLRPEKGASMEQSAQQQAWQDLLRPPGFL